MLTCFHHIAYSGTLVEQPFVSATILKTAAQPP